MFITSIGVSPWRDWELIEINRSPCFRPLLIPRPLGKTRRINGYPRVIPPLVTRVIPIPRLPRLFIVSTSS